MYTVRGVGKGDILRPTRAQIADSTKYAYRAEAGDADEEDLDRRCSERTVEECGEQQQMLAPETHVYQDGSFISY